MGGILCVEDNKQISKVYSFDTPQLFTKLHSQTAVPPQVEGLIIKLSIHSINQEEHPDSVGSLSGPKKLCTPGTETKGEPWTCPPFPNKTLNI